MILDHVQQCYAGRSNAIGRFRRRFWPPAGDSCVHLAIQASLKRFDRARSERRNSDSLNISQKLDVTVRPQSQKKPQAIFSKYSPGSAVYLLQVYRIAV
jgi:hypothetical protein